MNETFVEQLACAFRKVGTIHTVGEEWHSYTGEIPVGGVPYLGHLVTRETYSALWAYAEAKGLVKTEAEWQELAAANNGNVPFYSSGDGSTTFRMPKIVGFTKGASTLAESGSYIAEGLPNITGAISLNRATHSIGESYGAFSGSYSDGSTMPSSASGSGDLALNFNASDSNSIYGNSDHVTPETSVVLFGVYAFGAFCNVEDLDATKLSNAVATVEAQLAGYLPLSGGTMTGYLHMSGSKISHVGALELDGDQETNGGYVDFHFNGSTEDYTSRIIESDEGAINIYAPKGLKHNGKYIVDVCPDYSAQVVVTMPYTAPSKGWFIAHNVNVNATVYVNNVSVAQCNWQSGDWSGNLNCQILVDSGDVIKGASGTMRFIPCKGV